MQCQVGIAVEVVDEEYQRCRRLQADAEVLNEGSKVRDERRSTGSHKFKDGWLDVWVTSPTLGPTINRPTKSRSSQSLSAMKKGWQGCERVREGTFFMQWDPFAPQ